MKCPQCTRKIAKDTAFCPVCGMPQDPHIAWYDTDGKRILRLIKPHIQSGEVVREFTVGNSEAPAEQSEAKILLRLGAAFVVDAVADTNFFGQVLDKADSIIVLTNKRILIARILGWAQRRTQVQISDIKGISLLQIKGIDYVRGPIKGLLIISLDDGKYEFDIFTSRWGRHAENMAALF